LRYAHALTQHRDLHMSNVLVRRVDTAQAATPLPPMDTLWTQYGPAATQLQATIIDYSLSRMCIDGTVMAYDFDDEALFTGQGDTQYDVYRTMRGLVAGDWRAYTPLTNVLVRRLTNASGSSSSRSASS